MPVTVVARLSADAGNIAAFGTDGGLFTPAPMQNPAGWTLDNQWAASGNTGFYQHPVYGTPAATIGLANGYYEPVLFTRSCYVKDIRANITVAGAAASNIYLDWHTTDTSGSVGAKLLDYGTIVSSAAGIVGSTNNTTGAATVFTAGVLYWLGYWFQSASTLPTLTQRAGGQAPRGGAAHALGSDFTTAWACHVDSTTGGWGTRTTGLAAPVIAAAHTALNATAAHFQFQLQNA